MKKILAGAALAAILLAGVATPVSASTVDTSSSLTAVLTNPPKPSPKDTRPKGIKAIKGMPGEAPATTSRQSLVDPTVYFRYVGARQFLASTETSTGVTANLTLDPLAYLDTARGDYHTLGELIASKGTGSTRDTAVEVGFTKDPVVCGGVNKLCLFVFWWRNGVKQCYNGCGFVDSASNPVNVGSDISADVGPRRFQILYSGTSWWVAYNGTWVGYFPGSLWTSTTADGPGTTFTTAQKLQVFYEVASAVDKTCSDVGTGYPVSDTTNASRVGSMILSGKVPSTLVDNFTGFADPGVAQSWPATVVGYEQLSTQSVRASGPNWNATGTGPGTTHGC